MGSDGGTIYDRAVCAALFDIVGSRRGGTGVVRSVEEGADNDAGWHIPDPCASGIMDSWRFRSWIFECSKTTQHDGDSGCSVVYRMELFPSVYRGSAGWNRMRYLEQPQLASESVRKR